MKKLVAAMLGLMLAAGCAPALADESVYTTLYSGEVTTLNYLVTGTTNDFALAANVIDTLVEYDNFGNVKPSLATSWESNEDGTVWTFYLREDAVWVDADLNVIANVTAEDFVTAAQYVLDPNNGSSNDYILTDFIAGASEYYDGETEWENVGVKAIDTYVLQYTLPYSEPWFLSMLTYNVFMPVYGPFLAEKGEEFGLATGNDTILYNGAYVLSEFAPQEKRILTKNTTNWDAENVTIDRLEFIYNKEASTISSELYLRGEVDSASIDNAIATQWLADPEKADYIRPVRQTSFYSYWYSFNFDPQFDAAYEPENWKIAVVNENFRQALYCGLDRVKAMIVTDAENAENLVYNSITPPGFVLLDGVDYVNMGALADITAAGSSVFDAEKAIAYRDAAKVELEAAGATFPIKILMPYNPSVTGWGDEAQVIEQQLEALLGSDFIDIIVEPGPSSGFLKNVRRSGNYALLKVNWGPDYTDPKTFTDPFVSGNTYQFIYRNEAMADITAELYALIETADSIVDDMEARYLAYAEVEAYMVEHAIVIPFGFGNGGYTASRLDPFTMQLSGVGVTNERFKGAVLLDTPMSTDMYFDALDAWEEAFANQK